ncbi:MULTISPECIES: YHS domain-containing protein [Chryseobacterium]|uniref:YHS domain-containing protein n=1 Tax=Chryseobacterium candidae TaxID=1978493 RepID=A0ABY2RBU8_9FLAO|nr:MULTISPECIES: YHS domain-containing protein [Chryseobacterium]THV63081.1 YHS domain-containing protein [Chryseobacterium candidae]
MKIFFFMTLFCTMSSLSISAQHTSGTLDSKKVKVINTLDPICKMKTSMSLSDTAVYKNKIYGFCSKSCKTEFKKNPVKYSK